MLGELEESLKRLKRRLSLSKEKKKNYKKIGEYIRLKLQNSSDK